MKVFALTLVAILLIGNTWAAKQRLNGAGVGAGAGAKRAALEETKTSETENEAKAKAKVKIAITEADTDKKEKEVHKRGIHHYGGALTAAGSLWPKTYASHYGYGLHLPSAPVHSPSVLRYNSGFHYKALAAPSVLSGATNFNAAWPSYASLSPAVAHVHQGATSQPFIIRPGGAVVQSYSATYPRHKTVTALRPVHAFASSTPVQHLHPVQPVHTFQHVPHIQPAPTFQPVTQHIQPVQSVHTFQHVPQHIQPVQPVHHTFQHVPQHIRPVQPVHHTFQQLPQNIQPIHHTFQHVPQHIQPVQPVQPVAAAVQPIPHVQPVQHFHQPVQPVQTVVQVQHFKPPVHYDVTQQFPPFFQNNFVPSAPAPVPQAPTFSFAPFEPAFPDIPTFPNPPVFPTVPAIPNQPSVPDVPAVPAIPNIPTIPSIPNFPQPQVPANSFFPVNVQPPLNQKPPAFDIGNPQGQFEGFHPIAGNRPEFGSADASPQIPAQPLPSPEPELPSPQPEPTQQPWRPVLYEPPTAESPVSRPSHTLLPPYGNAPAQGYLPPDSASKSARLQQEYSIDSSLFDNISDNDIQQIFAQANLAAQRDHHHHTVHNYHTRY